MIDQFPFSFLLAVFCNLLQFWCLSLDMAIFFSLFFISRQALYSGFILSSLLFSVIVPVNQAPINILSFPRLVSLLTKQSSSYFFFLILFFSIILVNQPPINIPLFPPLSSYKIIFSSCKQTFLWRVNHTNLNKIFFSNFYQLRQEL